MGLEAQDPLWVATRLDARLEHATGGARCDDCGVPIDRAVLWCHACRERWRRILTEQA